MTHYIYIILRNMHNDCMCRLVHCCSRTSHHELGKPNSPAINNSKRKLIKSVEIVKKTLISRRSYVFLTMTMIPMIDLKPFDFY